MQLDVYVNHEKAGTLRQEDIAKFVFEYDESARTPISLLMPLSQRKYELPFIHPIFQVSMPEGDLRREIENTFGKRMDAYGDMSILSIVGASLIGRVSVIPSGQKLPNEKSIDSEALSSVLKHGASPEIIADFISRHTSSSGVSGGYMKVLSNLYKEGARITEKTNKYIVKCTDADHPYIALNEYISMSVARDSGIDVPDINLSDDGKILLVKRFDIDENGMRLGFEDMCSLLAVQSSQKFTGSVESVVKTIKNFSSIQNKTSSLQAFFRQYTCATIMRNGDAHLKNFGMIYANDDVRLSPCYDMVSMAAYAHFQNNGVVDDMMALTLSGTKRWPKKKQLLQLANMCGLSAQDAEKIINEVSDAIENGIEKIQSALEEYPDFSIIGERMISLWEHGLMDMGRDPVIASISAPKFN